MNDAGPRADSMGLDAALATLQGLLTSGETLEAWAAQRRLPGFQVVVIDGFENSGDGEIVVGTCLGVAG